jgi:hypothetical protein
MRNKGQPIPYKARLIGISVRSQSLSFFFFEGGAAGGRDGEDSWQTTSESRYSSEITLNVDDTEKDLVF